VGLLDPLAIYPTFSSPGKKLYLRLPCKGHRLIWGNTRNPCARRTRKATTRHGWLGRREWLSDFHVAFHGPDEGSEHSCSRKLNTYLNKGKRKTRRTKGKEIFKFHPSLRDSRLTKIKLDTEGEIFPRYPSGWIFLFQLAKDSIQNTFCSPFAKGVRHWWTAIINERRTACPTDGPKYICWLKHRNIVRNQAWFRLLPYTSPSSPHSSARLREQAIFNETVVSGKV
jgi:hypothetical protein